MVLKLADEAVVTIQQFAQRLACRGRVQKSGAADHGLRTVPVAMRVRGLNRSATNNKTEEQKREGASKHAALSVDLGMHFSIHFFTVCVRVRKEV
jgi:hypothetical protein